MKRFFTILYIVSVVCCPLATIAFVVGITRWLTGGKRVVEFLTIGTVFVVIPIANSISCIVDLARYVRRRHDVVLQEITSTQHGASSGDIELHVIQ